MIARVAKETFRIDRVVARIYDPRRAAIYERLGIPTVATVQWTTERVLRRIFPRPTPSSGSTRAPRSACSSARSRRVGGPGRRRPRDRGDARVVAVSRLGVVQVARPGLVIQEGDVVYAAVGGDQIASFDEHLSGRRDRGSALMRVVIAGGGNVGTFIAGELHRPATTC